MALELEELLAPISGTDRAGPDLAYDPQRHEIERAFEVSVSIDTNGVAVPDAEIDWRRIIAAIENQSARTKDLWLAVYLCRAGVRAGVLEIVETGARYLAGLIDRYWEDGHPRLEEYGVEGRTGACDTLASFREFVGPLRVMPLLDHPRHGRFTAGDLHRFRIGGEAEPGYGAFLATLDDETSIERLTRAALQMDRIQAAFRDVDTALSERAGAGAGTSFAPVYQALTEIADAARAFLPEIASPEEVSGEEDAGQADEEGKRTAAGTVRSREDVIRIIDLAIDYYRRNEPNSPVPLLLSRAREWVNRGFMEILEDIAPNAVSDVGYLLNFRGGAA